MKRIMLCLIIFFYLTVFGHAGDFIHLNKMVAKLEANQLVCGIWVSALHPSNAVGLVEFNGYPDYQTALSTPMIDFILIDMEHQPYDITALRNFLLALNSKQEVLKKGNLQPNIATLVRLPTEGAEPVHAYIKQVLDIGVHGIVIPHVRNAAEAEKIIRACRYVQPHDSKIKEPVGNRGASPWLCAYLWGLTMDEYVARADLWPLNPDGDIMAIIMIEDKAGVQNLDEILKVKGIGAVIFGPYDYSFSIGYPGQTDHPEVLDTWKNVKAACDRANVPLIGFATPDNIERKLDENYRILLFGHEVRPSGDIERILNVIKQKQ